MSKSDRSVLYKNNDKDSESLRISRQNHSIELRKNKRSENIQKRRNINIQDLNVENDNEVKENVVPTNSINSLVSQMKENFNKIKQLAAVKECRIQLSRKSDPPIDEFVRNGAVEILIAILKVEYGDYSKDMLMEAAWSLTNIASGEKEHTDAVVKCGGIDVFLMRMQNDCNDLVSQCIWGLSNIAGDCEQYRDEIIRQEGLRIISDACRKYYQVDDIITNLAWLLSNICRHSSVFYPVDAIRSIISMMTAMVYRLPQQMVKVDLSWAIAYAIDGHDVLIDALLEEKEFLGFVLQELNADLKMCGPVLRIIGNIIAGTNRQADVIVQLGTIDALSKLMKNSNSQRIAKECCWILSNIAAGSASQIKTLMDSDILRQVLDCMGSGDAKVEKEAAWVLSNFISNNNDLYKNYLININTIQTIVPIMDNKDASVTEMLLDLLKDLFDLALRRNILESVLDKFEEIGGCEMLEKLQEHESNEIYEKARNIVEEYLNDVDENNEEAVVEQCQNFNF